MRLWIASALCNAALFAVLYVMAEPYYAANDDISMNMISAGYSTGEPSEYLVFIHIMYGAVLKSLYDALPGIPWYPLLIQSLYFFVGVLICRLLLSLTSLKAGLYLYILFFIGIFSYLLLRQEFTALALLLVGMGAITVVTNRLCADDRRQLVIGLIAIGLGALVRKEALFGIGLLLVVWILGTVPIRGHWKFLMAVVVYCVVLVASWFYHTAAHERHSPGSSLYIAERSRIIDRPTKVTDKKLYAAGWNYTEYKLLTKLTPYDLYRINGDRVQKLAQAIESTNGVRALWAIFGTLISSKVFVVQLFLFLAAVLLFSGIRKRPLVKATFMILVPFYLCTVFLGYANKLPGYVIMPMLLVSAMAILVSNRFRDYRGTKKVNVTKWQRFIGAIALLFLLAVGVLWLSNMIYRNAERKESFNMLISDVQSEKVDLLLLGVRSFPAGMKEFPVFWEGHMLSESVPNIVTGGWTLGAPAVRNWLLTLERGDLFSYAVDGGDVSFYGVDTNLVKGYLQQIGDRSIRIQNIDSKLSVMRYMVRNKN